MKIAIMGTGGVGGYYGGLLEKQGHDVTFVARGRHLEVIQQRGLLIKSVHGDFHIRPAKATDNLSSIGTVELVLFCPKTYTTDEAAQQIKPLIGNDTTVMSLQNGIDASERIGAIVGMEYMIGSATWISSTIEKPGVIQQGSQFRRIVLGELDGQMTSRVQAIYDTLLETGITVELSDNILKILWTKFIFISAASGFGSLTRLPMSEYRSVPETRLMISSLMKEVDAVAKAQGITLDIDVVEKSLEFIDNTPPQMKASMQLDVEAGRRSEIEAMIGAIGLKGRMYGVPTPVADLVYASLLPIDMKARR